MTSRSGRTFVFEASTLALGLPGLLKRDHRRLAAAVKK